MGIQVEVLQSLMRIRTHKQVRIAEDKGAVTKLHQELNVTNANIERRAKNIAMDEASVDFLDGEIARLREAL